MSRAEADRLKRIALWTILALVAITPIVLAALSPLQRGREFLWVVGGMAGVLGMSLLLIQPFLMPTAFPRLGMVRHLRWHRWGGIAILAMVILHVGALYAYSPEDISDALLLVAPTPFSLYGVISLWCLVLTAVLTMMRRVMRLHPRPWRILHSVLAVAIVSAAAVHAVLIEGAMEDYSKRVLCFAALVATSAGAIEINLLAPLRRRRAT
jgi:predicted ferric reductase